MNPVVMRSVKNRLAVPVLIAALGLILTGRMTAQTFILLRDTPTELIRVVGCFCRETPCLGRLIMAAVRSTARFFPFTTMAPVLQTYIVSQHSLVRILLPTATELLRMLD